MQQPCRKPRLRRGYPPEPVEQSSILSTASDPLEQLRFIRQTMESAVEFTAVPGVGQMVIGATALVAAYLASRESGVTAKWVQIWLAESAVALVIAVITMVRKARRANQ